MQRLHRQIFLDLPDRAREVPAAAADRDEQDARQRQQAVQPWRSGH
jgi:hypothetical protein